LARTARLILALTCALLAVLAAPGAGAEQRVVAVRHWTAPDHTRVVVDLSDTPDYSTRVLTAPDRIVVFIQSGRVEGAPEPPPVGDGLVERVRLNQLDQGAQIVVDLARASAHNVFALKPYSGKPHRIVIDVFREGSAAAAATVSTPAPAPAPAAGPVARRTVVIDAGHGGEDPGAIGSGNLVEKDIVLDITKKLGAALENRPGFEVRYTRTGDYGVSLGRRRQIASQDRCDLFLSVHANSAPNKEAAGTEVFFLSPRGASDQKARELADRENAADLVGGVSPDADQDVLSILVDLKATDSIEKSADLGEMISTELKRCNLGDCSVKQAGFLVLKSLEMPSLLIEVGFLTNKSDRKRLADTRYREEYAVCLADAIQAYFERYQPAATAAGRHRVAPGETLWSIARRYGMSVEELRRVNHLSEEATIRVDQVLVVRGA